MLTNDERNIVASLFGRGPAALIEEGFSMSDVLAFLAREDVQGELRSLEKEFASKDGFEARSRWLNRRSLTRLAPGAIGVIGQSLIGPSYARDANGTIIRDAKGNFAVQRAEPTSTQLAAARTVIDTLGIGDPKVVVHASSDVNITALVRQHAEEVTKPVTIDADPAYKSEEERALSRERMRNAIERLFPRLVAKREELAQEVKASAPRKRKKLEATPSPKPKRKRKLKAKAKAK